MKTLLIALCLLGLSRTLDAQITFEKKFGTNGDNFANDVLLTSDGGYIIAGTTGFTSFAGDIILIRLTSTGDTLWTRTFGGPGIDQGNTLCATADGGYMISGSTTGFGVAGTDALLVKTDANGYVTWSKTYGTSSNDAAYGIVQTADGGYVFSGTEKQAGLNGYAHLVKVDATGNVLWSKTFGNNTRKNFAYTLLQTSDHGFLIGGWGNLNLGVNDDFCLIKTDSNGTKQWYKSYGDVNHDQNYSVCQANDGGFYIAGITFSAAVFDVNVVKTDANGNLSWTRNVGGTGPDYAYAVTATSDGGLVFCGSTSSFGLNNAGYLVKMDGAGNLLWSRNMIGTGWDGFFAIREANDGGLILAGVKDESYAVSGALYVAKTDANGNTGCNATVTSTVYTPSILVGTPVATGTSSQAVNTVTTTAVSGISFSNICSSCLPAITTPAGNVSFCTGTQLTITANPGSTIAYQWYRNGAAIAGATNQTFITKKAGNYFVNETSPGCNSSSSPVMVTALPTRAATITPLGNLDICQTGSVNLQANSGTGYTYQWMKGMNNISGATSQDYTATTKGLYKVIVTAPNGCSKISAGTKVVKSCRASVAEENVSAELSCYPNPSNGRFTVDLKMNDGQSGKITLEIVNAYNQKVYSEKLTITNGELKHTVDESNLLAAGIYIIRVTAENHIYSKNIVINQ